MRRQNDTDHIDDHNRDDGVDGKFTGRRAADNLKCLLPELLVHDPEAIHQPFTVEFF